MKSRLQKFKFSDKLFSPLNILYLRVCLDEIILNFENFKCFNLNSFICKILCLNTISLFKKLNFVTYLFNIMNYLNANIFNILF